MSALPCSCRNADCPVSCRQHNLWASGHSLFTLHSGRHRVLKHKTRLVNRHVLSRLVHQLSKDRFVVISHTYGVPPYTSELGNSGTHKTRVYQRHQVPLHASKKYQLVLYIGAKAQDVVLFTTTPAQSANTKTMSFKSCQSWRTGRGRWGLGDEVTSSAYQPSPVQR